MATKAVFFDVDFTLIYPGPTFDGEGYRRFAARHDLQADPDRFAAAVVAASVELDRAQDDIYRPELFIRYARRVLEEMGQCGSWARAVCSRDLRRMGRMPAFHVVRRRAAGDTVAARRRAADWPDFKHPSVSRLLSEPFSTRALHCRCNVFLGSRLHEAPPQYL